MSGSSAAANSSTGSDDAGQQRRLVDAVIATGALSVAIQPIADAETLLTVGVEALARFNGTEHAGPAEWFAAAHAVGYGVRLELHAIAVALAAGRNLPDEIYLAVNLGPETLLSQDLMRTVLDSGFPAERLVLELTEHAPVRDYARLLMARKALTSYGIRLSIDDVGAGHSLPHLLALQPDFAKLERRMTEGIEHHQARQSFVLAAMMFARLQTVTIIAEGVESKAQQQTLTTLGVDQLQGHFIGSPELQ